MRKQSRLKTLLSFARQSVDYGDNKIGDVFS